MQILQDHHVLVLGLGLSGLAMARWCTRMGAAVTVADTRPQPPQRDALQAACAQAEFLAGPFDDKLLAHANWTLIARSPGLSPAELHSVRNWAQARGLALVGELELFAQALRELARPQRLAYTPQVLAITGSNGKTTVTALTAALLQRAGVHVAVAGNIGPTLLDVLAAALDALEIPPAAPAALPQSAQLPAVWVLELSSFQLDAVAASAWDAVPSAATVLNISADHLDWHGTMAAYVGAKAGIFGTRALLLLNRDDDRVMAMQPAPPSDKVGRRKRQQSARPCVTFGLDAPRRVGDWGIESVSGIDWLVRAQAQNETGKPRRRRSAIADAAEDEAIFLQRLMPAQALRIRGRHNAANALAALALASSTGAALGPMLHGLREYRGEPHRVESVAVVNEVEYFDDSKGTNVGAALAAIRGLGAERRLVVILGGDGKGQDFQPLAQALAQHARAVLLIGRDAGLIRAAVEAATSQAQVPLLDAPSLPDAVARAACQARAGDAVLLSPACASLDMFDNYVHRGRVFRAAVAGLAHERGGDLEGVA